MLTDQDAPLFLKQKLYRLISQFLPPNMSNSVHSVPTRGADGFPLLHPQQDRRRGHGRSLRGGRPQARSPRRPEIPSRRPRPQSLWLPTIQAQLALDRKNSALALNILHRALPIEYGRSGFVPKLSCLFPAYIRGEAYIASGQGSPAAVEFQKILDHSGIVGNCWTGALAHLGVARANALQEKTSQGADADAARTRALAAYKDFLTIWKDADSDIPILKQAKVEFAKMQ
jgi:hypothetical protein